MPYTLLRALRAVTRDEVRLRETPVKATQLLT